MENYKEKPIIEELDKNKIDELLEEVNKALEAEHKTASAVAVKLEVSANK